MNKRKKTRGIEFLRRRIICIFVLVLVSVFRDKQELKGNQVEILNSPAAVNSVESVRQELPLYLFSKKNMGRQSDARVSQKTCQDRMFVWLSRKRPGLKLIYFFPFQLFPITERVLSGDRAFTCLHPMVRLFLFNIRYI